MICGRKAVKWSYKYIKQNFLNFDFAQKLRLRKKIVLRIYNMGVLLWNAEVCMNKDEHAVVYFDCDLSSLDVYLSPLNQSS